VIVNAAVAFLVLGLVFLPLEKLWPARRGQRFFRPGFRTDVAHFVFTGLLTTVAFLVAAIPIVLVVNALTPSALHDAVAGQPGWIQLVEALLIVEVVGYWSHRMMHTVPSLWKLHRVHHSSERLDWLASAHLHPFDAGIGRLLAVVPLAYLGFSRATFGIALVVLQAHAIFQHANLRFGFGRLGGVISSPQYHHWHHTNDVGARDRNFAGLFPFLDTLFGTRHRPASEQSWPGTYGVDDPMPAGYFRQLASPFRRPDPGAAAVPLAACVELPMPPSSTIPRSTGTR
jgi:sterol desaturase/sphingolipid hydroxylase (fatty acid hydroxylase superfamily)